MRPPLRERETMGLDPRGGQGGWGGAIKLVVLAGLAAALTSGAYYALGSGRKRGGPADEKTGVRASSTVPLAAFGGRIALAEDDGDNLDTVCRRTAPELYYRVVLENAPVGARLPLTCDWVDPAGRIVHQNRYETREVNKPVWPTHARFRLGAASPTGTWSVRLSHQGRTLSENTFSVVDDEPARGPTRLPPVERGAPHSTTGGEP